MLIHLLTKKKVSLKINGDTDSTNIRTLNENNKSVFKQSAVDSFIMAVKRPLGKLNYLKIWHDNSGKGDLASWFLKHIIVHDLQTREKFYFICQNWLAVEKSDGKIERELFIACDPQKTQLEYLLKKQASHYIMDNHLWFSVFNKPVLSSFTRLDRVTCCFLFHYISMLLNIICYGVLAIPPDKSSQIDFSLFRISLEQVD